jgi:ketosteroid isomerase-like protein
MDAETAEHFAAEWIDSWNSHDLERILAHWADECTFSSPLVVRVTGDPSGTVRGKQALRDIGAVVCKPIPN